MPEVPYINPRIRYVGVSYLRKLNCYTLRTMPPDGLIVVTEGDTPLAVLVPYKAFIATQEKIQQGKDRAPLICPDRSGMNKA